MDENVEAALMEAGARINAMVANERRLIDKLAKARKDSERYRMLRDGQNWPAAFASANAPEPLRGADLDAAIDGTEPMIDGWPLFSGLPPPATPAG